jgi:CRP/FNR family transcriptional regulator
MIKQGAFSSYILFVIEGISKQYIEAEGARNLNLHLITPGEFVGLTAVFAERKFNYSVTALSDTRVFLIETEAISKLIQLNADFSYKITKRYFLSNAGFYENLHDLYYKQLNGRMANVLLYIDGFKNYNPDIFSLLTRKDIAEFAGMSTESAVKILKSFEKDGLLQLAEKNIMIVRHDRIREISKTG